MSRSSRSAPGERSGQGKPSGQGGTPKASPSSPAPPPAIPAISIVTLGVKDLEASLAFYEALGFADTRHSQPSVKFMRAANAVLGLYGRAALAEDAQVEDEPTGFPSASLAMNRVSEAEVDAMFERAIAAGAKPLKRPQKVFWGGYSGYFADLDGHMWEVAFNPFFPMDENGILNLEAEALAPEAT